MLEFVARHVIIGPVFLDGDHFHPEYADNVLDQWETIEREIGHEAWMNLVTRRAGGSRN